MGGGEEGRDVLGRDAGLDVVYTVEDVAAAGLEGLQIPPDVTADLLGTGEAQNALGIDTQRVLSFAGPEEIRRHVRRNLEAFKPGGGYVFNSVHNIQAGVPPENIAALFAAAHQYGFYR